MATLIGDFGGADYSSFHTRGPSSALPCQQPQPVASSTSRDAQLPSRTLHQHAVGAASSLPSAVHPQSPPLSSSNSSSDSFISSANQQSSSSSSQTSSAASYSKTAATPASVSSSRIPTPPDSSFPRDADTTTQHRSPLHTDGITAVMAPTETETAHATAATPSTTSSSDTSSTSSITTVVPAPPSAARPPPPTNAIPSPASDGGLVWTQARADATPVAVLAAPPPTGPIQGTAPRTQQTIRIRDLGHIQKLAQLDTSTGNGPGILNDPPLQDMKFEISGMPIADIIEMVAALLTKITTTNDHQHDALHRNASQQRQAQAHNDGSDSHSSPFSASVLAFHGKNVPAITILSYLSRIHKYCPTTYEVFLSLLVYFDRMTERVNELVMRDEEMRRKKSEHHHHQQDKKMASAASSAPPSRPRSEADVHMRDEADTEDGSSLADETDEDLADSDDDEDEDAASVPAVSAHAATHSLTNLHDPVSLMATYFVVDSFNIHRLIIAGVTCASKFFSDVFYTNSRYAKVGGLPLAELNHLELQFLILNDFRLAIPIEDLEAYATMLVEFYAREVVGQRPRAAVGV